MMPIISFGQPLVVLKDSLTAGYLYNYKPPYQPSVLAPIVKLATNQGNAIAAYLSSTSMTADSSRWCTVAHLWAYAYPMSNPSGFISMVHNYYGTIIHSLDSIETDSTKFMSTYAGGLKLSKSDSITFASVYQLNLRLLKSDSTIYASHYQNSLKLNITDTSSFHNQFAGKQNNSDTTTWDATRAWVFGLAYLSGTVGFSNGGTGQTSLITAPTASTIVGQDANKNYSTNNELLGYTTTATAGGTTTLTVSSTYHQEFTGTLTQSIVMPVTSTLVLGQAFEITENSTGTITVKSSGGNTIATMGKTGGLPTTIRFRVIGTALTTAADWEFDTFVPATTATGFVLQSGGSNASPVWTSSPTIVVLNTGSTGYINIGLTPTNAPGSLGGSVDFSQPFRGTYKEVTIYCNSLNGTASYTYPTAFTHTPPTPTVEGTNTATVTAISTTSITITGIGASSTGWITFKPCY